MPRRKGSNRTRPRRIACTAAPLRITAAEGASAPTTFSTVAYTGEAMNLAGFKHPVVLDVASLRIPSQSIPLLYDHADVVAAVIGQTDEVAVRAGQVTAAGRLTIPADDPADSVRREVVGLAEAGFVWQASVGGDPESVEFVAAGSSAEVNGRSYPGPVYVARGTVLREISTVVIGGDGRTSVVVARDGTASTGVTAVTFEEWVASLGLDPAALTDDQKAKLKAEYDRVSELEEDDVPADDPPPAPVRGRANERGIAAHRRAIADESRRTAAIRRICASADNPTITLGAGDAAREEPLEAHAIEQGWMPDRVELHVLRHSRPNRVTASNGVNPVGRVEARILEAAAAIAGGLDERYLTRSYDEPTLTAAQERFGSAMGLQELILTAARANGYHGRMSVTPGNLREVLAAAMPLQVRAAVSSYSLSGVLSNVANKYLMAGYKSQDEQWRLVAATRPVKDFKSTPSYRMYAGAKFLRVGADGAVKSAEINEVAFSNQADTFARLLSVDRKAIINDDLGALTQAPQELGRGGADGFNELFWSTFMNNSTFFAAGNNNYLSGAGSVFGPTGVSSLKTQFMKMKKPDGTPLAATPGVLLVPPELEDPATVLLRDRELRDGSNTARPYVAANPHAGAPWKLVSSSYLSNALITGNSATAYYLLANPASVPVIEACFLNGAETPTVTQSEMDPRELKIDFLGYFDFGVALQDYRGGQKSAGA